MLAEIRAALKQPAFSSGSDSLLGETYSSWPFMYLIYSSAFSGGLV